MEVIDENNRQLLCMTQQEFAFFLRVSPSLVALVESNRRSLTRNASFKDTFLLKSWVEAEEVETPTLEQLLDNKTESLTQEFFQAHELADLCKTLRDRKFAVENQKRKLELELKKATRIFKANYRARKFLEGYIPTLTDDRDRKCLGFALRNAKDRIGDSSLLQIKLQMKLESADQEITGLNRWLLRMGDSG